MCSFQHLHAAFLLLSIAAFACIGGTTTHAQNKDVRLSPIYYRAIIPDDAKIQSAARIGTLTLVVWGSSAYAADSSIVGTLHAQLLRDSQPIGSEQLLTSPQARPSGFVQAIALADRFLIFWNDRHGDSASYTMQVDTTGAVIGGEVLFWKQWISAAGIARTPTRDGFRLFWSDRTSTTIYARDLDRTARFATDAIAYDGGPLRGVSYPANPPGYTILDRGELPPIVLDEQGDQHSLGAYLNRLALPYFLDRNGSLATIQRDTLKVYRSLLDSAPERLVAVPFLQKAIPGSVLVGRDSAGRIVVSFAQANAAASGVWDEIDASIFNVTETLPDTFATPMRTALYAIAVPGNRCRHITASPASVQRERGAGNNYRVRIRFEGVDVFDCPDTSSYQPFRKEVVYTVDGGLVGDTTLPLARKLELPVGLERMADKFASNVAVTVDSIPRSLSAQAAMIPDSVPQLTPGITSIDGKLVVGWLAVPGDTLAKIGTWNLAGPTALDSAPSLVVNRMERRDTSGQMAPYIFYELRRLAGKFVVGSFWQWNRQTDSGVFEERMAYSLHLPTAGGWKTILHVDTTESNLYVTSLCYAFDPLREETEVAWNFLRGYNGTLLKTQMAAFDRVGEVTWGIDNLRLGRKPSGMQIVPLGVNEFIAAFSNEFRHFKNNTIIDSLAFPYPRYGTFTSALGPYVLQWRYESRRLILSLVDLHGNELHTNGNTLFDTVQADVFVLANPVDTSFTALWGGSTGLHLATFDRNLKLMRKPMLISDDISKVANPSAMFRNDTLFVVWEGYRNGIPAIYGKALSRLIRSSVEEPTATPNPSDADIASIVPNPAGLSATIILSAPARAGDVVEIIDLLGTSRLRVQVNEGETAVQMNTAGLPSGRYVARIRRRGSVHSRLFTVVH
jgi:hypothetical protein